MATLEELQNQQEESKTGLYTEAARYYNSPLTPFYPGQTVAGMTPNQLSGYQTGVNTAQNYIDTAGHIADEYGNMFGQSGANGGMNDNTLNQVNGVGASFDPFNNPGLNDAITAMRSSSDRAFEQQVAPTINDDAIGSGQRGSSRHAIQEAIMRDNHLARQDETEAKMRSDGYKTGLNQYVVDRNNTLDATRGFGQDTWNQLERFEHGMQMPANADYAYAGQLGKFGTAERSLNQARMDAEKSRYDYEVNEPYKRLVEYGSLLSNAPGANTTTQHTDTSAPNTNWGDIVGGGIMSAYGAWGGGNITPTATTTRPVYTPWGGK